MFSSFPLVPLPSSPGRLGPLGQAHTRTLELGGGPRVQVRVGVETPVLRPRLGGPQPDLGSPTNRLKSSDLL